MASPNSGSAENTRNAPASRHSPAVNPPVRTPRTAGQIHGRADRRAATQSHGESPITTAYQLGCPQWTDRASGIGALALIALACRAGTALLVEDLRGSAALIGRRGEAAAAVRADEGQAGPDEPGVRQLL